MALAGQISKASLPVITLTSVIAPDFSVPSRFVELLNAAREVDLLATPSAIYT